jgi:asparaginyl-tRNA synthetase
MTLKLSQIQKSPEEYAGPVAVCGWVRTVREGKTLGFIELTDGTCFRPVQVVYERDERNLGNGLSTGCAIAVQGELVLTPDAPQPFEVRAEEITIEGACPATTRCRRSATRWSTFVRSSTCVRVRTRFRRRFACARW